MFFVATQRPKPNPLVGFGFFEFWFQLFHGIEVGEAHPYFYRAAASWLAFLLLQILAYLNFEKSVDEDLLTKPRK